MSMRERILLLRQKADRLEASVSSDNGPSSQHYVSPERFSHYIGLANDARLEADRLEAQLTVKLHKQ